MPKLTQFCKHYPPGGAHGNDVCDAGVDLKQFKGVRLPCGYHSGEGPTAECPKAEFPTDDEIAAEEAEIEDRHKKILAARDAIVSYLGGSWHRTKNRKGGSGAIDCPACGGKGTLKFVRSSYNGHIHASCSTDGCVGWME